MLLARDLSEFPAVARKASRGIRYRGTNKVETEREVPVSSGDAVGFDPPISAIMTMLLHREVIACDFRHDVG